MYDDLMQGDGLKTGSPVPIHGSNYGLTSIKERSSYLKTQKNLSMQRFGSLGKDYTRGIDKKG